MDIAFGPVPSRRLGRSLGINHVPPKICTYACIYCQLGRTIQMQIERKAFYNPGEVVEAVLAKVAEVRALGEPIDYLTFVPDGEPTLDINLGAEITALQPLCLPIAVISNASLIHRPDVRKDLMGTDWVSLKVDAVDIPTWRRVNRPHGQLDLEEIMVGIRDFSRAFNGQLATETMLVEGVNDGDGSLRAIAAFLGEIAVDVAYLAIPTRPPAEAWVRPSPERRIHRAYQLIRERVARVRLLLGYEGNAFSSTGDAAKDLLSITAVHPMREDAVGQLLKKDGADWSVVEHLVQADQLVEIPYDGNRFYLRRIKAPGSSGI